MKFLIEKTLLENQYKFYMATFDLDDGDKVIAKYLISHVYENDYEEVVTDCDEMIIYKYNEDGEIYYGYKTRSFGEEEDFESEDEAFNDIFYRLEDEFLNDWGLDFEIIEINNDADITHAFDRADEMGIAHAKPEACEREIEFNFEDGKFTAYADLPNGVIELEGMSFNTLVSDIKEAILNKYDREGYPVEFGDQDDISSFDVMQIEEAIDNKNDPDPDIDPEDLYDLSEDTYLGIIPVTVYCEE